MAKKKKTKAKEPTTKTPAPKANSLEAIEQADWQNKGDGRMSDSAIHGVTLLFFDALEAQDRQADEHEKPNGDKS